MVDAWRKFANSSSKVIMLRYIRNSRLQENFFIWKQNPIRKLESCESRFLWKNASYSRTTWQTFAYTTSGTRTTGLEVLVQPMSNPRPSRRSCAPRLKVFVCCVYTIKSSLPFCNPNFDIFGAIAVITTLSRLYSSTSRFPCVHWHLGGKLILSFFISIVPLALN